MMMPVQGAACDTAGGIREELASVTGRARGGHGSMRGLLVRFLKWSKTEFLLFTTLWIPFLLLSLLVQSHPVQGGCEAPGTGSFPEESRVLEEVPERTGPGSRPRQAHRRIMDPGFIGAVSGHFRSIFGEQAAAAVYLTRDFLLIRTGGFLGAAEQGLLETGTDGDSDSIRAMKLRLAENNLASLASDISRATGLLFSDSFLSYSPAEDEMMVMLTLSDGERG